VTRRCPFCGSPLYGGPTLFGCTGCHRNVYAADLATEHTTLTTRPPLEVQ
jgi:hypothetical protein